MRIAGSTISRNYNRRLQKNLAAKYSSENKITSYRQFDRASECPAQAASAMRVRKAINNLNRYEENLKTADNIYTSAESSVMQISELIQSAYEKTIEAANGTNLDANTHSPDQLEMIALSVETFGDEIMRLMNLTVADRKIFGGSNNSTNPYAVITNADGSKSVTYNGVSVNTYTEASLFPSSNSSYCDIGLGMTLLDNGQVDPQSALKLTFNGAEILGCGYSSSNAKFDIDALTAGSTYRVEVSAGDVKHTVEFMAGVDANSTSAALSEALKDAFGTEDLTVTSNGDIYSKSGLAVSGTNANIDANGDGTNDFQDIPIKTVGAGYSNNVIQNIYDCAQAIREGDGEVIAKFADQIFSLQTTVSLAIADIGNAESFIEFNQDRVTENLYSLTERQNDLESTDLASESTTWTMLKSVYDATLQMSASVIPTSIFNFIN